MYKRLQEYNTDLQQYNSKLQTELNQTNETLSKVEHEKSCVNGEFKQVKRPPQASVGFYQSRFFNIRLPFHNLLLILINVR
ncbi:hypothetical protein HanRHA438_Chr16g0761501 [Helianthus annuus]|nr:hypothetical protein HanIR_Chr16g0814771 [Helianthus annuus]KAJ0835975.1 hypothetical protein HanRHA438_Chr16g0761501 [Helianthus annuus]